MKPQAKPVRIPSATYRLQFNRDFKFQDARALLDYLEALGISGLYSSPIFTAPPDSNHGYDVCDYNQFNPVLGNDGDWTALTNDLRARGMGLLLDFVPNHMGAAPEFNSWWRDVLEFGMDSPYADFFDIDWNSTEAGLKNRVLLPILEDSLKNVLEKGLLKIGVHQGAFQLHYRDFKFPINPRSYRRLLQLSLKILDKPSGEAVRRLMDFLPSEKLPIDHAAFRRVKSELAEIALQNVVAKALVGLNEGPLSAAIRPILEEQTYQLEYWRTGTLKANFRRFFDVNSLIALNMNRRTVFEAAHALLFKCVRARQITGIRLDHIDGLADPLNYLQTLQAELAKESRIELPKNGRAFYVLVEKITMTGESLRCDWPVFGSTGYDFGATVTGVLIDSSQKETFTQIYESFIGHESSLSDIVRNSKQWIMKNLLAREVALLSRLLKQCAGNRGGKNALTRKEALMAVSSTITWFPIYRTYITPGTAINSKDAEVIKQSVKQARDANPDIAAPVFDLLQAILLREPGKAVPVTADENLFRQRFQQFTGPIMAKSFEDTAFFVYNRMIALNEVGADPARFGVTPKAFHEANAARLKHFPHTMLTTSTHDTKLSEDARARLAALSQVPSQWANFLKHVSAANAGLRTDVDGRLAPDRNEEYLIYQILLATWPFEEMDGGTREKYTQRIQHHLLKALREAKTNTRWDEPNSDWESAVNTFIGAVINQSDKDYLAHFESFAQEIMERGAINSLSQTLLKLTSPGVPDIYQGNELWQFLLTDPDNRGPVDFSVRQSILGSLANHTAADLLHTWQSGALKMFLIRTVLQYRRAHSERFKEGGYVPLSFDGKYKDNCLGFARTLNAGCVITLVPRLTGQLGFPPIGDCWDTTAVDLGELNIPRFTELFTGRVIEGASPLMSHIFREVPFAVLIA